MRTDLSASTCSVNFCNSSRVELESSIRVHLNFVDLLSFCRGGGPQDWFRCSVCIRMRWKLRICRSTESHREYLNEKLCGTRSSKAEQLHNESPFKVQTGIGGAKKRLDKTDKSCLVQGNGKRGETKKFTVLWLVGRA